MEVARLTQEIEATKSVCRALMPESEAAIIIREVDIPEAAVRGVTIRGLKAFAKVVTRLCSDGVFNRDQMIDGQLYTGTKDYQELKTAQLVHMWVRDKAVTGERRLVDCPQWIEINEIGVPCYFTSHAWKGSFADLLETIFKFQIEKNLPDETMFW